MSLSVRQLLLGAKLEAPLQLSSERFVLTMVSALTICFAIANAVLIQLIILVSLELSSHSLRCLQVKWLLHGERFGGNVLGGVALLAFELLDDVILGGRWPHQTADLVSQLMRLLSFVEYLLFVVAVVAHDLVVQVALLNRSLSLHAFSFVQVVIVAD